MPSITPFLWFNDNAEEAMNFYTSVFANSKIEFASRSQEGAPVSMVGFELEGQSFLALNGGPVYEFSPAISLFVSCDTQEEIDHFWTNLSEGGTEIQCGWLRDKFGITWQIVPKILGQLMSGSDPERVKRVFDAMLKMVKMDIAGLQSAYDSAD